MRVPVTSMAWRCISRSGNISELEYVTITARSGSTHGGRRGVVITRATAARSGA
jgi:hypothetical protein